MLKLKVLMLVSTIVSGQPNTQMREMANMPACLEAVKQMFTHVPAPDKDHSYGAGCILMVADTDT